MYVMIYLGHISSHSSTNRGVRLLEPLWVCGIYIPINYLFRNFIAYECRSPIPSKLVVVLHVQSIVVAIIIYYIRA
jgi:hypothetical protein